MQSSMGQQQMMIMMKAQQVTRDRGGDRGVETQPELAEIPLRIYILAIPLSLVSKHNQ
eukprot:COSAG01_NODE_7387_length_3228_cov_17.737935_6_plen_58_part_00